MEFDQKYLKTLITVMKDNVDDLSKWSAYNGDKLQEEAIKMETMLENIRIDNL